MVKTLPSNAGGGPRAKVPHATCLIAKKKKKNQRKQQESYCGKFKKTFKMIHIRKIFIFLKNYFLFFFFIF